MAISETEPDPRVPVPPIDPIADPNSGAEIRSAAARGVLWIGAARLSGSSIDQVFAIALARLLAPADFGIFALASVFTSLFRIFVEMGLSSAIIQRPEIDDEYLSTAFWGSLAAGILLLGLSIGAGELIALITGQPLVSLAVIGLSVRFVFAGGSSIQMAILTRRMDFRAISIREVGGALVGGAVGVTIALTGGGMWALVGQAVALTATSSVLIWWAVGWRPKRVFSVAKFKDLWGFSGPLLGARLVMYLNRNTDNLLIGRFLGPQSLGFYAFAYNILMFPLNEMGIVVNRVAFPALSRVNASVERLREGFLQSLSYASMALLPAMAGLALVAPYMLEVIFGAKWLPATNVLRVLAVSGAVQGLTASWSPAIRAAGRPDLQLRWTIAAAILYLPAFAIGLFWGIEGVAIGFLAATTLLTPLAYKYLLAVMPVHMGDLWRALRPGIVGVAVMAAGVWPFERLLARSALPPAAILAVLVAAGVVLYGGTVWLIAREQMLSLVRTFRNRNVRPGRRRRTPVPPAPEKV